MAKFLQVTYVGDSGLKFIFGNGKVLEVDINTLSAKMKLKAAVHGINQKCRDSTASCSKTNDYATAWANINETWESIAVHDSWNRNGVSVDSDLVAALAQVKSWTVEKADEVVGKLDEDQMKLLRASPAVKAAMLKIKSERANALAAKADKDEDELAFLDAPDDDEGEEEEQSDAPDDAPTEEPEAPPAKGKRGGKKQAA